MKAKLPSFWLVTGLMFCYVAIYLFYQHENFPTSVALYLGLMFAPFIFRQESEQSSIRFLWPALFCLLLLCFFKSATLYYFAIGFGILFLIESYWGRFNNLPILLLIIIAPFFRYVTYIWSFPIRLTLSKWAAKALTFIGFQAEAQGNIILLNNEAFEVEPACVGLKMIGTALVCCLIIMAYFEEVKKITFSVFLGSALMVLSFCLTILANFSRLLALVIFHVLPANPMHDLIGLASLVFYVLLPFWAVLHFYFTKKGKNELTFQKQIVQRNRVEQYLAKQWEKRHRLIGKQSLNFLLIFLLIGIGWQFKIIPKAYTNSGDQITLPGFERTTHKFGVLAFEKEETLVYVKPPVRALQGAHDPRICWQGSGFNFNAIQKEVINGTEIFTAIMTKEKDQLYTAWWYDNGQQKTIVELDWRLATLKSGKGFHLINVSSYDRELLLQEVEILLNNPIL